MSYLSWLIFLIYPDSCPFYPNSCLICPDFFPPYPHNDSPHPNSSHLLNLIPVLSILHSCPTSPYICPTSPYSCPTSPYSCPSFLIPVLVILIPVLSIERTNLLIFFPCPIYILIAILLFWNYWYSSYFYSLCKLEKF